MRKWPRILVAMFCLCAALRAEISVTIDKLDPSDGIPVPPSHFVVVDVAVSLSQDDAFDAVGLLGLARNGAAITYARDPNEVVIPTAPGVDNRFVTFFSRPRARDSDARFLPGASVQPLGRHIGEGPADFLPTWIDALLWVTPPNREPGRSGWVGRIVIDLSNVTDPAFRTDSADIVVATSRPANSIPLFEALPVGGLPGMQVVSTSFDDADGSFGIYGIIPEPATAIAFLAISALASRRTRGVM